MYLWHYHQTKIMNIPTTPEVSSSPLNPPPHPSLPLPSPAAINLLSVTVQKFPFSGISYK